MNATDLGFDPSAPPPARRPAPRWLPVRLLGEQHRSRVLRHLLALGDDDRHLRFGHLVTDTQIEQYVAHLDFARDRFLAVFDSRLRIVALAHLALAQGGGAEFGVSVLAHHRGRGFGSRLFEHAALLARNRGVRTLTIHLARENQAMLTIVRRSGALVRIAGADVVAELPLPEDTLGSQIDELLGHQAAEWDYRLKRHTRPWWRWLATH